jgi:hypothetical protein
MQKGEIMNRSQKIAWFTLVACLTALTLSLTMVAAFYFIAGQPLRRALSGFSFIGLCGFSALALLIFRKEPGKVTFDERDVMIQKKAPLRAYTMFWFLFVLSAMVPFFIMGPEGAISIKYLPAMVFGGMFTVMLVQSIVTLEQYGRGGKDKQT